MPVLTSIFFKTTQKLVFTGIVLLIYPKCLLAQYNIDSIKALPYEKFEEYFIKSSVDSVEDLIYANAFLAKAKKEMDTIRVADAYLKMSYVNKYEIALKYADSVIELTKKIQGHKLYPAKGYFSKGRIYYHLGELQMAVDQYLIAHHFAKSSKNNMLLIKIKASIAGIKNRLGEKEEALRIIKDYVNFVEKSRVPNKDLMLAKGFLGLAIAYSRVQKFDSATIMIKRGMEISKKKNYIDIYANLLSRYGLNLYHTKNYQASIDTILKSIELYDLKNNISFAWLYLGKSYLALKDTNIALNYFFKVDSFLCNNSFIMKELLDAYPPIIGYYEKRKDYKEQLFYTNQLIKFDSIFYTKKTEVTKNIAKKYDIPMLLTSKEELIEQLNKDKNLFSRSMYLLLAFSVLLMTIVSYFIIKNRRYKERFDKLLNQLNKKEAYKKSNADKTLNIEETKTSKPINDLDSKIVNNILARLDKFEKSERFTKKSYTVVNLAKELKTNSSYLSKIINDHKGQKFSDYFNNLKINYIIERLKSEPKFRAYTIEAIAKDAGFNNARTFSSAFHKKTGLYPSYFIKQLKNKEKGK